MRLAGKIPVNSNILVTMFPLEVETALQRVEGLKTRLQKNTRTLSTFYHLRVVSVSPGSYYSEKFLSYAFDFYLNVVLKDLASEIDESFLSANFGNLKPVSSKQHECSTVLLQSPMQRVQLIS